MRHRLFPLLMAFGLLQPLHAAEVLITEILAKNDTVVADKDDQGLEQYSQKALARVWKAERFSWWFTSLIHHFPEHGDMGQKFQDAELDYLIHTEAGSRTMAENYVGLPLNFGE